MKLGLASLAVLLVAGCVGPQIPPEDGALPTDCRALLVPNSRASQLALVDANTATVSDLQFAMAEGDLTSEQLVAAYLDRIAFFDDAGPTVNAIRHVNEDALAQARALDAERAAGRVRGPLHGIPVLLKDNVGTNDMPTTAGSIALALNVPPDDATITANLREAGAIILGKTNLSEFANWDSLQNPNGFSTLGGQVLNAYTGGDPSGSSSGSGVAASLALAAATVGTETSGSIISPSLDNSVVGVKPTMGLVSRHGIIPLAENFDVPGPMVRNVEDAAVMLAAMMGDGPDPDDAATQVDGRPDPASLLAGLDAAALQGARIGYVEDGNAMSNEALAVLAAQGAVLVPVEGDDLQLVSVLEIGLVFNEFKFGLNDYLAKLAGPGLPVSDLTGIIVYNAQNGVTEQEQLIASDATPGLQALADAAALPVIAAARSRADAMFEGNDLDAVVALGPDFVSIGAAAGYPTVAVPAGYDGNMPRGLTFFGPEFSEPALLGFAYDYEQATRTRVPPTALEGAFSADACRAAALAEPKDDATKRT